MTAVWWLGACALLLNVAIGLACMMRRRRPSDWFLALLLFGTGGVALVLVLAQALERERAVDLALVLALLAAILGVAAVRLGWFGHDEREPGGE